MVGRIDVAHAALTKAVDDYQPEILIIIGGDQTETFDCSNVPQFMVYLGEEAWGIKPGGAMGRPAGPSRSF